MSADEFTPADEHPVYRLRMTMKQKIISCQNCEARYSDKLDKCPECGEPQSSKEKMRNENTI